MIDFLFQSQRKDRVEGTDVSVSAVSMVEISEDRIDSIGSWLREISLQSAEALRTYKLIPDLFEWKKFVKGRD